ncbi:MAG TPA: alpha-isopropylmalate synthase regulatory domain-containing protein [Bacteroidales bacterium]|nr:alpha-isopropylmalate synthase regulatory domain-containing protein [Bacteroidales bacterium]
MKVEIMDTTLRDGEQTSGVSFTASEKLSVAKMLLEEIQVDRIEVASAKVSDGEFKAVKRITEWAGQNGYLDRVEVLGFIDGNQSIDWISDSGAKVVNLLCKGSLKHLTGQLKKTPEQHVADIKSVLQYALSKGLKANIYFEDWSNGMRNSREYVLFLLDALKDEKLMRIMLPDTLGILNSEETYEFVKIMTDKAPNVHFDFHAHNDYDLATANVLASVKAGARGIHTTVNGLGERAGNAPLASVVAVLHDHAKAEMNVDEEKINVVSKLIESFSGIRIPANKPVVGENVFTQTCGVHADGDSKDKLYFNELLPERFGRVRKYALGKTAGKSNIMKNLQELGIELDPETMKQVTKRVIELGDRKENVTTDDLPFIISDILNTEFIEQKIKIKNYSLSLTEGLKPVASVSVEINKKQYQETSTGDGQYDAFMNALKTIYKSLNKEFPKLLDYAVAIPPGGKTDALVETVITWQNSREFKTRGLDSDQTIAAIKATVKMLNIIEH